MECSALCPYCFEPVEVWIDLGGGTSQRYVEDCPVCCRPWEVVVHADEHGEPTVQLLHEDA